MIALRGLLLLALASALGLPTTMVAAASPAGDAALAATVVVGLGRGDILRLRTGTLLHARNGEAIVFAVLPRKEHGGLSSLSAADMKVSFRTEGQPIFLPVQELIWCSQEGFSKEGLALLRVEAEDLPPPPGPRVLVKEDAGAAVTVGCCVDSLKNRSIRVGVISSFQAPARGKEAVPIITVTGQAKLDSGAPVVDAQGKLIGCARFSDQDPETAQVIPVLEIWEFMWQKFEPLEFSMARHEDQGWVMECRPNLPLLTTAIGDAAVGLVSSVRARQTGVEDRTPPDTAWVPFEDKNGPFCLLPVSPPEAGKSTYSVQLRQQPSHGPVLYRGPVVVVIGYQFDSPAKGPWLQPWGEK